MIRQIGESRKPIDLHRLDFEKKMVELIRRTPAWAFIKAGQHPRLKLGQGFAEKGAAIIIGEAGDPLNYPRVNFFWKRLGVGIWNGERQQRRKGLSQEETLAMGYKPSRRAEMWALADSMYKHQVRHAKTCWCKKCSDKNFGDEDGQIQGVGNDHAAIATPSPEPESMAAGDQAALVRNDQSNAVSSAVDPDARPIYEAKGNYGPVFIAAYNKFRDRGNSHAHAKNHGTRMMWKECLRDFWQAWRTAHSRNGQIGPIHVWPSATLPAHKTTS